MDIAYAAPPESGNGTAGTNHNAMHNTQVNSAWQVVTRSLSPQAATADEDAPEAGERPPAAAAPRTRSAYAARFERASVGGLKFSE